MSGVAGDAEEDVFQGVAAGVGFQRGGGVECEQAAFVDDRHAIGEEIDFGERVGGEEQGGVAALQDFRFEEAAEFGGGDGVQAARGLVEEQDARLMQEGAREADALHGAGGERADLAVDGVFQVELLR